VGSFSDPEIERQARLAYKPLAGRVLRADAGPSSRTGARSFDDIELAVADVHWAKEHGLGGVMMPALFPGGIFFFDPALDPVWAACVEVGLPISQHGGTVRRLRTPGFAAIMTLALEHSFYSAAPCGR